MQPFVCPRCNQESTYDPWIESARCPACGYKPRPAGGAPPPQASPAGAVDRANQLILDGRTEEAKRVLGSLLRANPDHVLAWELLSRVVGDPAKQADCYRQILRIDPDNRGAADALCRLTGTPPATKDHGKALHCPGCDAPLEVRFVGEMHDKRAVCPYCGLDVDLPDTYQRVQRRREHETHRWGSRTVDTVLVQGRTDLGGSPAGQDQGIRSLEAQMQQALDVTITGDVEVPEPPDKRRKGFLGSLLQRIIDERDRATGTAEDQPPGVPANLSTQEVIQLAGGPLPVEERRECPQCKATISKEAAWCQRCGTRFSSKTGR